MTKIIETKTARLRLRQWNDSDLPVFARLNADPIVMEYFPGPLTKHESNSMARKIRSRIDENGWGFWALEMLDTGEFIGFTGLNEPSYETPVTPCIEIGWRLAKDHWGYGYATEAARACLEIAFYQLKLSEVYSYTSVLNKKSRAVMERLGMVNMNWNFEHPMVPASSPLREHCLYRIRRDRLNKNR